MPQTNKSFSISVVIPTWNRIERLKKCLPTFLATKIKDVQFIIVDNNSDDGTWDYLKSVAIEDERVEIHRNSQNVGGKTFAPKREKLKKKINLLINSKIKKFTLANVLIYLNSDRIIFLRENRNIFLKQDIKKNCLQIFDGRFGVMARYNGKLFSSNDFGLEIIEFAKSSLFSKKTHYINKTIPILKTLEGRVISPYLNIIEKKDLSNLQLGINDFNLFYIKDLEF